MTSSSEAMLGQRTDDRMLDRDVSMVLLKLLELRQGLMTALFSYSRRAVGEGYRGAQASHSAPV